MADSKEPEEPQKSRDADDGRLNRFLTELVHMQDSKLVKESDLASLLDKYDLHDDDLEKLQMLVERHMGRAGDYKRQERWDNAIVETERALLFSPLDNVLRLDLAELFINRSAKYGYLQKDLRRAENEVRDALVLEPENKEARKFQKELIQLQKMLRGRGRDRRWIPLLILLVLVLGAALYPQIRKTFQFFDLNANEDLSPQAAPVPLPWETKELVSRASEDLEEDFDLTLVEKTLIRDSDAGMSALNLAGYLKAENGSYEVLSLNIEDTADNDILTTIKVVDENSAPLRKGQTVSFNQYLHLNKDPETVGPLRVSFQVKKPLYEESEPLWSALTVHTEGPVPQDVFLDLEKRDVALIEGYDRNYLFMDLKLENKGSSDLGRLDFNIQLRDGDDGVLTEKGLSYVEYEGLPLKADSIQSKRIMFALDKSETMDISDLTVVLEGVEKNE